MIDLNNIEAYRENNRLEAKRALGGLPHSIWETYSAFANALGGVILLGVEELEDHSLRTVDLPDPEGMAQDFWEMVNDPKIASANILTREDILVETIDGDTIIAITVPQATEAQKPIYIFGDALNGSYYRCGEGDYKYSREQVQKMLEN